MSPPFYIWQVQQKETEYQYDNAVEFSSMKEMLDLYKESSLKQQFVPEINQVFTSIDRNYKYNETKQTNTK